jgi:hypothetical protein
MNDTKSTQEKIKCTAPKQQTRHLPGNCTYIFPVLDGINHQ